MPPGETPTTMMMRRRRRERGPAGKRAGGRQRTRRITPRIAQWPPARLWGAVRLNHPRRDLVRSIGSLSGFPSHSLSRRGRFLDRNIWPDFRVFRIQRQPFLKPRLGVRLDRIDRAFRLADAAIDAFVRVDDEHVLALVEAVHRAHLDAVHDLAANAALVDDVGQLSVPSADRSGELIHGVRPRGARSLAEKWTQRRPASSGSIGTPNSRHLRAEGRALVRLQHISPPRYVQSWQIPSADGPHSQRPWSARGAGLRCIEVCSSGRASPRRAPELRTDRAQSLLYLCSSIGDYASPIRLGSLSDQVPTRLKRLNGLRCGATGRRLKFRECRRVPRELSSLGRRNGAPSIGQG